MNACENNPDLVPNFDVKLEFFNFEKGRKNVERVLKKIGLMTKKSVKAIGRGLLHAIRKWEESGRRYHEIQEHIENERCKRQHAPQFIRGIY